MVGEIRDPETAEIAINSAMTGHLVLSTLHTNDAATTLPRLVDMGVPPFLVAYTANIIIAQRLVRKICQFCKKEYRLDQAALHELAKVFDTKKLNWTNSQYIKRLAPSEFKSLTSLKVSDTSIPLITERLEKLSDVNNFEYLWKTPGYDKELLIWKGFSLDKIKESLQLTLNTLEGREWTQEELRKYLDAEAGSEQLGDRGLIYWPLRAALTGKEKSPDPVEIAVALGKEETIKRIEAAIDKLTV